jgi:hypothetical protein
LADSGSQEVFLLVVEPSREWDSSGGSVPTRALCSVSCNVKVSYSPSAAVQTSRSECGDERNRRVHYRGGHDRITNATTTFDSFGKAYAHADARSI